MNKPNSLRAHLLATVAELKHNPDRLLLFIDEGGVRCTSAASLSWEYTYTLQLILTDYAGHPDLLILPLLGWLSVHQPELLANLDTALQGIAFEADIIDSSKVDLSFRLPLTERVVIGKGATGDTTIAHPAEPQPARAFTDPAWNPAEQPPLREWFIPANG